MRDRVLIAGAGPVGLTMALELSRYGVPVRIVDKHPETPHTSRPVAIWPRTLELTRSDTGLEEKSFLARGLLRFWAPRGMV